MRQRYHTVAQETLAATVAFLQESGGRYDGRLHLAVAQSFALVHLYLAVARALQTTQLIVFLCARWTYVYIVYDTELQESLKYIYIYTFNQMDFRWKRLADFFAASILGRAACSQCCGHCQRNENAS